MDVYRDPSAIIHDLDRVVDVDRHIDLRRVSREGFVDRVVDYFVNEVVESSRGRRPDVHAGTLPDRLETFENLDLTSVVLRHADFCSCFSHYSRENFLLRTSYGRGEDTPKCAFSRSFQSNGKGRLKQPQPVIGSPCGAMTYDLIRGGHGHFSGGTPAMRNEARNVTYDIPRPASRFPPSPHQLQSDLPDPC